MCLTRDALFRLLNNHGPDFAEQWEVPVWVKARPGKGEQRHLATQAGRNDTYLFFFFFNQRFSKRQIMTRARFLATSMVHFFLTGVFECNDVSFISLFIF